MIYSKSRNFIFLRVPKTASTSIYHQILDYVFDKEISFKTPVVYSRFPHQSTQKYLDDHPNIEFLLQKNLIQYNPILNVYGIIREPIDRIISCAHHFYMNTHAERTQCNNVALDFLYRNADESKIILLKPQVHWLTHNKKPINKIFRYDQLNLLVTEICGDQMVKYNHRSEYRINKTKKLSTDLIQETKLRFADDFSLWDSMQ